MGNKERRQRWCDSKADELTQEADINLLSILPSELQLSIQALVHEAYRRGYNWGFNDGCSFIGTGREPAYYVAEAAAENIAKPHNAA